MLNENRVVMMSEIAIFEEKNKHKLQPASKYLKRDYVALNTVGGVVSGTVAFAVAYGLALIGLFTTVITNLSALLVSVFIILGIILYALFMYFYLRGVIKGAVRRYNKSRELVQMRRRAYAKLLKLYDEEEATDIPEGWG